MYPFDLYKHKGQKLLGKPKNKTNARYGYDFELLQLTRQTKCAYCQVSLVDSFDHWLTLSVDHVVPTKEAKRLGISLNYSEDFVNLVLCCVPCNWFNNRHRVPDEPRAEWDFDEFLKLRDREFERR